MADYAIIQNKIDKGLGIAARVLGPPFAAYRCDQNASGDFPTGWTAVGTAAIRKKRIRDELLESNLLAGATLFYRLVADMSTFLLGDCFVCTDPPFQPGVAYGAGASVLPPVTTADPVIPELQFDGVALCWHPPVMAPTGARLDRRVRIYRSAAGPQARQDGSLNWNASKAGRAPLVLTAGLCQFGATGGDGSWFPAGFGSTERPSRGPEFGPQPMPTTTPIVRYYCYLPPLPGYWPKEGDEIISEDGVRHLLVHPFYQDAGVVGSQLVIDRVVMQR